jgi:hypothetical protein
VAGDETATAVDAVAEAADAETGTSRGPGKC